MRILGRAIENLSAAGDQLKTFSDGDASVGFRRHLSPIRRNVGPSPKRGANRSNLGVLGKGECVFHIDSEIADRALDLAMAEQDLDGTQITGCPVDDRCLRSAERVRTIFTSHQTDPCHPFIDKPGEQAGDEMPIMIDPTREHIVVHRAAPLLEPGEQASARVWKQLEVNRSACFLLHDNRSRLDLPAADKVADLHPHQVATPQLAVDHQIEQRPVSHATLLIEVQSDFPNLLGLQSALRANGSAPPPARTALRQEFLPGSATVLQNRRYTEAASPLRGISRARQPFRELTRTGCCVNCEKAASSTSRVKA